MSDLYIWNHPCFNGCGRTARPGFVTCEECERVAAKARETPGTVAYALAHPEDAA